MFDASLLNLPLATLVTLAAGYVGYFIANVGLNEQHKTVEVTFSTLVFGLMASFPYHATLPYGHPYLSALIAIITAILTGSVWRMWFRKLMYHYLRKWEISLSDNSTSAWQSLFDQTDFAVTEVLVFLKDGSGLQSVYPGEFDDYPNGPFTLGNKGDVILYVTHSKLTNSDKWVEYEDVIHKKMGALATYIPADQISRIELRRKERV